MFLKLDNGMTFKFVDQGDDVQVVSESFTPPKERWFSRHTHLNESFSQACKRKSIQYSIDYDSCIHFFTIISENKWNQ